ncbi:hypothetical protein ACFL0G_06185, partial [Candidatus Zixiibacteriota bacterium]
MKMRLWVLILVLVIGMLATGIYLTWNRAGIDKKVEGLFVSRLASLSGAEVQLREFNLGPGYARVRGLSLADEERGLFLSIDAVRISYSLLDHALGGFRAQAGLKEVLLSSPQLHVDLDRFLSSSNDGKLQLTSLVEILPQRITVVKGLIELNRSEGEGVSELAALDGWMEMLPEEGGSFRCTGSWGGGGEKNLLISGSFGHQFETHALRAELHQADLTEVASPALPARYSLRGDILRGSLTIEKDREAPRPIVLGELAIEADELVDKQMGIHLEKIRAQVRLEGSKLTVERIEAAAHDGLVQIQGQITDLRHPELQLQIEAKGLQAAQLFSQGLRGSPDRMPRGQLDLTGNLRGWGDAISFQGQMASGRLEGYGTRFKDFRAQLTVRNSQVELTRVKARLPWAQCGLQGILDLAQSPAHIEAKWRLDRVDLKQLSADLGMFDLRGDGMITGRLTGPAGDFRLRGGLQLSEVSAGGLSIGRLNGQMHWEEGRLSYRLASAEGYLLLEGGGSGLSRGSDHQGIIKICHLPMEQVIPGMKMAPGEGWIC